MELDNKYCMFLNDLFDDINVVNDKLAFDYRDRTGVSTALGKSNFVPYARKDKTLDGYTIYSVYASGDDSLTDVLLALKKKSFIKVDPQDYEYFLKRTAIFITSKILRPTRCEIVITPRSSTTILNDILKYLQAQNPHIEFLPESYVKTVDLTRIEVDRAHPQITDKIAYGLERIIKNAQQTGKFEIKKALPQYRKFFRNFFEVVDPRLTKKFAGRNICVLDDVLSSGTTVVQILKDVANYAPAEAFGCTLFKTK